MSALGPILGLLLLLIAPAFAQGTRQPIVRTSLKPADGIVIGQPVQLNVDVLFPGEMPRPPLVKVGEAPGAQILRFETQATTMRDRIDGQDYVGQRFEFTVFPRRGGAIDIPAAEVTLRSRGGDSVGSLTAEPIRLSVTVPPGIDPSGPVLAAPEVRVSQNWSRDPASATFKVGDAVTRTIQRQAAEVPALGMAEFRFTGPDGVAIYPDAPLVEDKVERGSVEGVRTDKVAYVFEKPGTFALPALAQPWWDIDGKQARTETLAGATFTVVAAASPQPSWRHVGWQHNFALSLCFGVLLIGLTWLVPRFRISLHARRLRYIASEAYARQSLRDIARNGDAAATYRALAAWLERLPPERRAEVGMDHRLQPLVTHLEHHLFGQGANWSRQTGIELADVAEGLHRARNGRSAPKSSALPPLNPLELSSEPVGSRTGTSGNYPVR